MLLLKVILKVQMIFFFYNLSSKSSLFSISSKNKLLYILVAIYFNCSLSNAVEPLKISSSFAQSSDTFTPSYNSVESDSFFYIPTNFSNLSSNKNTYYDSSLDCFTLLLENANTLILNVLELVKSQFLKQKITKHLEHEKSISRRLSALKISPISTLLVSQNFITKTTLPPNFRASQASMTDVQAFNNKKNSFINDLDRTGNFILDALNATHYYLSHAYCAFSTLSFSKCFPSQNMGELDISKKDNDSLTDLNKKSDMPSNLIYYIDYISENNTNIEAKNRLFEYNPLIQNNSALVSENITITIFPIFSNSTSVQNDNKTINNSNTSFISILNSTTSNKTSNNNENNKINKINNSNKTSNNNGYSNNNEHNNSNETNNSNKINIYKNGNYGNSRSNMFQINPYVDVSDHYLYRTPYIRFPYYNFIHYYGNNFQNTENYHSFPFRQINSHPLYKVNDTLQNIYPLTLTHLPNTAITPNFVPYFTKDFAKHFYLPT